MEIDSASSLGNRAPKMRTSFPEEVGYRGLESPRESDPDLTQGVSAPYAVYGVTRRAGLDAVQLVDKGCCIDEFN